MNIKNNKLKGFKTFAILSILCVSVTSFAQEKMWTLEACVSHALEHNITIKQAENTLLTNNQDIIAAKGQFLPSVSGSASQGLSLGTSLVAEGIFANRTSHSTNLGVSVSQTVFNGFRNLNNKKSAFLNLETNVLELNRIKDDISLNVVNAYLNVLFNKENLETAKAQFQFSEKQLDQVKSLVDAGAQPKANVYDAEATLSRDAQQVTLAENNFNLALLSLSQLLQVPYNGFNVEIIDINTPSEALMYNNVDPVLNYACWY